VSFETQIGRASDKHQFNFFGGEVWRGGKMQIYTISLISPETLSAALVVGVAVESSNARTQPP
jgi:hypothetical protein